MTDGGRRLQHAAQRLSGHHTKRVILTALATGLGLAMLPSRRCSSSIGSLRVRALRAASRGCRWPCARPPPGGRRAAAGLAGPGRFLAPARLRNLEEAARRTESQDEGLKDRIVPALQVLRTPRRERTGYSPDLVDAVVDRTAGDVEAVRPQALPYNVDLRKSLRWGRRPGPRHSRASASSWAPTASAGDSRSSHRRPGNWARSPPSSSRWSRGTSSIPRGESVKVAARVEHARPDADGVAGAFEWRTGEDQPWRPGGTACPGGAGGRGRSRAVRTRS